MATVKSAAAQAAKNQPSAEGKNGAPPSRLAQEEKRVIDAYKVVERARDKARAWHAAQSLGERPDPKVSRPLAAAAEALDAAAERARVAVAALSDLRALGYEPPQVQADGSFSKGSIVSLRDFRRDWYVEAGILTAREAAHLTVTEVVRGIGKSAGRVYLRCKAVGGREVYPIRAGEVKLGAVEAPRA